MVTGMVRYFSSSESSRTSFTSSSWSPMLSLRGMEKAADKTGDEKKATSINLAAGAHLKLMEEAPVTKATILSERKYGIHF